MKIRRSLGWLLTVALVLLCGCSMQRQEEKGYVVYYVNSTGTRLVENSYSPAAETFDEMMEELIGRLSKAPNGYVSALPENVKFNGYERGIDALRVDFSPEYYDLSNTEEVLLRAAVVKTVCQIPGVMKVMITVDKEQLRDSEGELVPAMDANSFIDTKEGGINSYQYATLVLFFANEDGSQIVKETRNLHYSSNMVLERVVIEQLIKGPEDSALNPVLGENVRIQNIYTQNGICTITFDEEVNKDPSEKPVDAEAALYAIVNSICSTCDSISGVKFEISGDSDAKFRGVVNLDQIFMMNQNVIEQDEMQTDEVVTAGITEATEAQSTPETAIQTGTESDTVGTEVHQSGEVIAGKPLAGVDPSIPEE